MKFLFRSLNNKNCLPIYKDCYLETRRNVHSQENTHYYFMEQIKQKEFR